MLTNDNNDNLEKINNESNETTINELNNVSNANPISDSIPDAVENNVNTQDIKSTENIEEIKKETTLTIQKSKHEEKKIPSKEERSLLRFMIFTFIFAIYIIIFSTLFAVLNSFNTTKIAKGVSIKGINVSNLTYEEAKEKINKALNIELNGNIDLIYNDETLEELSISDIKYTYNTDLALQKALEVGKSTNLLIDNYKLLYCLFFGLDFDISYSYNEDSLQAFTETAIASIPNLVVQPSYYIDGDQLIIDKGKAGLNINSDLIKKEILENIYNRNVYKIIKNKTLNSSVEIKADYVEPNQIDIAYIYEEIHCEPQDAYFIADPFEIKPEQDGIDFAISIKEAQKIVDNKKLDEYSIPLTITPANLTIDDIGVEAFPYKISTFSTKYDASNINRSGNLKLAADKINGKVLMPGDTFSFNEVVGKRTIEDGYKNALIYENGQVVNGLAGGICQISSTLYNAALLANLEITERYNHSYTSTYVPAGRDATVVYGAKDFKFTNTRNYPIKLEASVEKGTATFTIYGVAETEEYDIKISSVTTSVIPYNVIYTPDPTLAPGQQKVTQAGHSGYRVTTYIERSLNGIVVSKDVISNDVYKAMNTLVNIGQ